MVLQHAGGVGRCAKARGMKASLRSRPRNERRKAQRFAMPFAQTETRCSWTVTVTARRSPPAVGEQCSEEGFAKEPTRRRRCPTEAQGPTRDNVLIAVVCQGERKATQGRPMGGLSFYLFVLSGLSAPLSAGTGNIDWQIGTICWIRHVSVLSHAVRPVGTPRPRFLTSMTTGSSSIFISCRITSAEASARPC